MNATTPKRKRTRTRTGEKNSFSFSQRLWILTFFLMTLFIKTAVAQITPDDNNILYVNQNVNGSNESGNSWANALPELADALKWVREQHDVDNDWLQDDPLQIWVAGGTYYPLYTPEDGQNFATPTDPRDKAFLMVKNVQLYGGFPDSGNPTVTDRDWENNPTVLSGDIDEDEQLSGGDAYHVLISANDVDNAFIDGFTVTGGNANGSGIITVNGYDIWRDYGGGMYNSNSSLSLTNVKISENGADHGGGIYNDGTSTFYLTNVAISGNTANNHGGGIYNYNLGSLDLTNVEISGNTANDDAGGIFNSGTLKLTTVEISGNTAGRGGGIFNYGTLLDMTNVVISGNTVNKPGGGHGGGIFNSGTLELTNTTFSGNTAVNGIGGGIFNNGGVLDLINIEISENTAVSGGGIYNTSGTLNLVNVEISGNTAYYQGGIENIHNSTLNLTNVTLANNSHNGIYNYNSSVSIANSIVWNAIANDASSSYVAQNSIIMGSSDATGLNAEDIFTDATGGDYSLALTSPAINAGSNQAYEDAGGNLQNDLDLADNPRVFDVANGGIIDMGAYEYQGEPSPVITLTVAEGWRMLSSPVDGLTYDDMLGDLWTQGFPGSDYEGDANTFHNVYTWDSAYDGTCLEGDPCPGWIAPSAGFGNPIPPGSGFLMYVYRDDEYGQQPEGQFPKTLVLSGLPPTGDVSPQMNTHGDGWTLVGNPYSVPVSFDDLTKVNLVEAAYVYDLNAMGISPPGPINGNGGAWRSISGMYGDIPSGKIAPGQGFFVQNTTTTPSSLTFTEGSKTTGGEFYGKENELRDYVRLEVQGESLYNSAWIRFSEDGSLDQTDGEALELQPLAANYAMLGARKADGTLMDIAHFPLGEQDLEIPLAVEATQSGKFTIRATDLDLPAGMVLYLHDRQRGESMSIDDETFEYSFSIENSPIKRGAQGGVSPKEILAAGIIGPRKAKTTGTDRFLITTTPGSPVSELPDEVALGQNYPNPFNPTTVIRYQLPVSSDVRLEVYDMLGRSVATLVDGQVAAGTHQVSFDANNLSSGVYLYRLTANGLNGANQIFTKKLTLIK